MGKRKFDGPAQPLTDALGNTIEPGDTVAYSSTYGTRIGKFIEFNGFYATVRPTNSYKPTRYRDKRTGKNIDPYATDRHWAEPRGIVYVHTETGEVLTSRQFEDKFPLPRKGWWDWGRPTPEEAAISAQRAEYRSEWREGRLYEYVEKYKGEPSAVAVYNVNNIVKVVTPSE